MINEKSAGAVVFFPSSPREYLLLHYIEGHWDLPKGHIERGEKEEETARREAKEETGLDIEILPGFRHSYDYVYRRGKETYSKNVVFFLASARSKDVHISYEHQGFVWLPFEGALKKVTFENARTLLKKANDFLEKKTLKSFTQ